MIVTKPIAETLLGKSLKGRARDYYVLSEAGTKNLGGPYANLSQAKARLRQVEYFKHNPECTHDVYVLNPQGVPRNKLLYNRVKREAKERYAVWPSAYGSGWLVKEYKRRGGTYNPSTNPNVKRPKEYAEMGGLTQWYAEKWVDISRKGDVGGFAPCGRKRAKQGDYPKCVPLWKAKKMTEKEKRSAIRRKRELERGAKLPKKGKPGRPPLHSKTFVKNPKDEAPPTKAAHIAVGASIGGVAGHLVSPILSPVGAAIGGYAGSLVSGGAKGRPFFDREHDFSEVLIDLNGVNLTRQNIISHYKKFEKKMWPYIKGQTVMVVLAPKKNRFVLRRKGPDKQYIKITKKEGIDDPRSLEYWVMRRAVEFHVVLTSKKTPLFWVDLDMHSTKDKALRIKLRRKMLSSLPTIKSAMQSLGAKKVVAFDSGQGGMHVEGVLSQPKDVDILRRRLRKALSIAFEADPSFTTGIPNPGQIRLDTTTLHQLGALRAPYSMTVTGGVKKPK